MCIWYWMITFTHSPHGYATSHVAHLSFYGICMLSHLVNCYMSLLKIIQHSSEAIEQSECAFALCVFFTFLKQSAHACVRCVFEWVKWTLFPYTVILGTWPLKKSYFWHFLEVLSHCLKKKIIILSCKDTHLLLRSKFYLILMIK